MNQWWQSLEQRERMLVSVMGIIVVIAAIYWLLIQPLFQGTSDARERLATAEQNLAWMKRVAPILTAEPSPTGNAPAGTLIAIVDQTSKSYGLEPQGNRRLPNNKLQVQFDQSSFESLVKWFGDLHNRNVYVDTANFTRVNDVAGTTNATVTVLKGSL